MSFLLIGNFSKVFVLDVIANVQLNVTFSSIGVALQSGMTLQKLYFDKFSKYFEDIFHFIILKIYLKKNYILIQK